LPNIIVVDGSLVLNSTCIQRLE